MLLLALLCAQTYKFPVGRPVIYHADMKFVGYLPILGIGQGKAEVHGTFEVIGKTERTAGVKLTAFDITFNGGKIPIDLDDAKKYVPGGTFTYTPYGSVSGWNAPTVAAPIRVPGLDLKHLPEVLFLPISFPAAGMDYGKPFTFSLPLSGGEANYTVKCVGSTGETGVYSAVYEFKVHQSYTDFEDDANQVVPEKDAAAKVVTDVVGTGSATFDSSPGRFTMLKIDDVATSAATDLQTKNVTTRKLTRHLVVTS